MITPRLNEELNATQREIVAAAARCFMYQGYDRTTINEIAAELGCTKGRIYHHFRSKSEIFFSVYRQAMQYCLDAAEPIVELALPASERLRRLCEAHALLMIETLSFQRSIKQWLELYLRRMRSEDERETFRELLELRDTYEALFRRVLRDGIADGTLLVPDVSLASRTMLSALNGIPDWYRQRPDGEAPVSIARKTAALLVDGLLAARRQAADPATATALDPGEPRAAG